ncbi:MAG: hypothetical protein V4590_02440 [Bacteroidota bacterium]
MNYTHQHTWNFSTVGGVKRVNLDSGADLMHLHQLDQKLWTALSCPVYGLEIDHKTLALIDTDNDGQIRVPEMLAAVKWMIGVLKNADDLLKQDEEFPLSAIDDSTDEGRTLISSANIMLRNLGKENATSLTVAETSDTEKIFAASRFNGDGIITEDTVETAALKTLLNEVMACAGSVTDLGGKSGISIELLQQFTDACSLHAQWYAKAEGNSAIFPLGKSSEEAYASYSAIKAKVDDYFIRCRLAAFNSQTTAALNLSVARVEAISEKDLSASLDEIATYPLAKVEAGKPLPLSEGINPAWEKAMLSFNTLVSLQQFLGKTSLTESDWSSLEILFTEFVQWKAEEKGATVESLGLDRIKEILSGQDLALLTSLIEQDKALEHEASSIMKVDQLVRYYRDLYTLLKNFVTFYDFYSPGYKSIFQAGTLYIDQRSCDLCIRVTNMEKHGTMASMSGMFLMYCECTSRTTSEKMVILAALTNGDIDNLVVGRNALFYDRQGTDWDATIIKIIDNPISIRQAFWSPYRKVSRFVETQVNKFAASQDDKVTGSASKGIEDAQHKIVNAPAEAPKAAPPFDIGKFVGIFAAISLALGAIGAAIASVIAGFLGLTFWKMPLAISGVVLLISGPAMIMAYLKLRKRNLAPILDANGWAINANVIVNIQFGNLLTHLATLPPGAKINLNDPFSKKKRPFWPFAVGGIVLIALVFYVLWKLGFMHL